MLRAHISSRHPARRGATARRRGVGRTMRAVRCAETRLGHYGIPSPFTHKIQRFIVNKRQTLPQKQIIILVFY